MPQDSDPIEPVVQALKQLSPDQFHATLLRLGVHPDKAAAAVPVRVPVTKKFVLEVTAPEGTFHRRLTDDVLDVGWEDVLDRCQDQEWQARYPYVLGRSDLKGTQIDALVCFRLGEELQ